MSPYRITWTDSNLTPAAERLLDDVMSDLRSEIVHTARRRAVRYPSLLRDIGVREVVHAFGELDLSRSRERRQTRGSLAAWLTFSGVLFLLTVMIIILQVEFPDEGNSSILLNLAGTVSATLTAATLAIIIVRWSQSEARSTASVLASFLDLWIELEAKMRIVVSKELGESRSSENLDALIEDYAEVANLNSDDRSQLRNLLGLRNDIVHGETSLSEGRLEEGLRLAKRYLMRGRLTVEG
jgi:hypothetical protein